MWLKEAAALGNASKLVSRLLHQKTPPAPMQLTLAAFPHMVLLISPTFLRPLVLVLVLTPHPALRQIPAVV